MARDTLNRTSFSEEQGEEDCCYYYYYVDDYDDDDDDDDDEEEEEEEGLEFHIFLNHCWLTLLMYAKYLQ